MNFYERCDFMKKVYLMYILLFLNQAAFIYAEVGCADCCQRALLKKKRNARSAKKKGLKCFVTSIVPPTFFALLTKRWLYGLIFLSHCPQLYILK